MKNATYITIGKIGASYGVCGWIKINPYTEVGTDILAYHPWYLLESQDNWKAVNLEDSRLQGETIIVKLPGINTPEQAKLLTGKLITVTRLQLPVLEKDKYYWSDLEGLTVIDQHGKCLGTVSYLIATGSNDVLVVKGKKEQAIPYLPGTVITKVDLIKQEIVVKWEPL